MQKTKQRNMVVTSALPYANGPIHIGHLLEYIQTDIWVRFQRLVGNEVTYVCADDAHGTPIMLHAEKLSITPEKLIADIKQQHQLDFSGFFVEFSHYHSTHSKENQQLCEQIYTALVKGNHISKRTIEQFYDTKRQIFLPDRFIKGICPKCGSEEQYGDGCDKCNATYAPIELLEPVSVLSNSTPVLKKTDHLFFKLPNFKEELQTFIHSGVLKTEVSNKLSEWFDEGLQEWDISRDRPYFGFEIPGEKDKFFYVWLDAPIGYFASLKALCDEQNRDFESIINPDSNIELFHFIGKDIIYFHALFWPALLKAANMRLPNGIYVHGFVTVNGEKMSKSRGTFISAASYLNHLPAEYLRYYFASKLSDRIEDIDINLDDFVARVNSDLVGKIVNIASRSAKIITDRFDGMLADAIHCSDTQQHFTQQGQTIKQDFEQRKFSSVIRTIVQLADKANQYIDKEKPWISIKNPDRKEHAQLVATQAINLFRLLILYLKPVLPETAKKTEQFLNIDPLMWSHIEQPVLGRAINPYQPMMQRVNSKQMKNLVEENKETLQPKATEKKSEATPKMAPEKTECISVDDFSKIKLKVGKIQQADYVAGADKLLKLIVDVGGIEKQIFAGIRATYQPEALIGRLVVVLVNLKPRKMRFGVSEAMVLAASDQQGKPYLVSPDEGSTAGMDIK